MKMFEAPKKVKQIADEKVVSKLSYGRDNAFQRFPLFFTLMGAFGLVATTDGFQRLMGKIPFFANNPYVTLIVGLVILLITGTLYKKL
jgi:uncharacterized membrane protein